ncbi:hypothetical protein KFL_005560050 [Klebsormidium nitens]|uniref:DUF5899 domain-containing protein n=1 Tax=Klebsormidium nitens TaxID=105231 RepID=A0A1Y1ILT0_KLENI|nr:hypothetical protein KFL_005560050 [Klebsormidium nitens]|eukprot:GAQ89726.1 hypothetical protein KFL_005560050 [Klebsormidium nitens]
MIFVEFGRVKAQAGTNAALAKVRDELRNLAIVQLVSGVILTMLGFLYLHSGKGQEEIKGTLKDSKDYVHRKYRDFQNKRLSQELEQLEARNKQIRARVNEYKRRLDAAPLATGKEPSSYSMGQKDFARRADLMSAAQLPACSGYASAATGGVVKGHVPGLRASKERMVRQERRGCPMVPFFRRAQNAYSEKLSERRLETFSGTDPLQVGFDRSQQGPPTEAEGMFDPTPDRRPAQQVVQLRDRVATSTYLNKTKPFEPTKVGPGIGISADATVGNDGFHPMLRILLDNVGAYKLNQLPQRIHAGANPIAKAAPKYAEIPMKRPALLVENRVRPAIVAGAPKAAVPRPDDAKNIRRTNRAYAGEQTAGLGATARSHILTGPCRSEEMSRVAKCRNVESEALYASGLNTLNLSAQNQVNPGGYLATVEGKSVRGSGGRGLREHANGEVAFGQVYASERVGYTPPGSISRVTGREVDNLVRDADSRPPADYGVGISARAGGIAPASMARDGPVREANSTQRSDCGSQLRFNPARSKIAMGATPVDSCSYKQTNRSADAYGNASFVGNPSDARAGARVDSQAISLARNRVSEVDRTTGGNRGWVTTTTEGQMGEETRRRSDSDAMARNMRIPASDSGACRQVACSGADLAAMTEQTQTAIVGELANPRATDLSLAQRQLAGNIYNHDIGCSFDPHNPVLVQQVA